jgi:hypothetical protein
MIDYALVVDIRCASSVLLRTAVDQQEQHIAIRMCW